MGCHLLEAASKRCDHVAGVDEIEGLGLQTAVEKIIDGELHVGDPFCLEKRTGANEQALVACNLGTGLGRGDPMQSEGRPRGMGGPMRLSPFSLQYLLLTNPQNQRSG